MPKFQIVFGAVMAVNVLLSAVSRLVGHKDILHDFTVSNCILDIVFATVIAGLVAFKPWRKLRARKAAN